MIYVATAGALHLWIGSLADWTTVLSARLEPEKTAALIQAQYRPPWILPMREWSC